MNSSFDVIIVGGGIAGAGLGAHLADQRRTLIIEAESHCGFHSTGRSAAFYLESYGGPDVAGLTRASAAFLANPPSAFADRGFLHRRGAVHLSTGAWPTIPTGIESFRIERGQLDSMVPGLRPQWRRALVEPNCADIDVGRLHQSYLGAFRRSGGVIAANARLKSASHGSQGWRLSLEDGRTLSTTILVNAGGAWADEIAKASGAAPIGLQPRRRTMVQLRVGRHGLKDLPLIADVGGSFYFKGESDNVVWLSPHDEIASDPCDAAPEEIDVAVAVDRFERAVDWPVEAVERSWAGLRSFAPDRLPVYGFDPLVPAFFWCAGQGGFGIQTAPAASLMAAAVLLGQPLDAMLRGIDPLIFSPNRFG